LLLDERVIALAKIAVLLLTHALTGNTQHSESQPAASAAGFFLMLSS